MVKNGGDIVTFRFTKTEDALPAVGEPVFIYANGVVQHITYVLELEDSYFEGVKPFFQPYYFETDAELVLDIHQVESWAYVDGN